jgi:hypothetical protein
VCIKSGNSELSTVKALMTMSLNSIFADVFDIDLDDIQLDMNLQSDLKMTDAQQQELAEVIAEYFDDLVVDFSKVSTVDDVFNIVVEAEFEHIPEEAF